MDHQPNQPNIQRPRQGIKTRGASSFKRGSPAFFRGTSPRTVAPHSVTPPVKRGRGIRTRGGVSSAGPKNTGKRAYNKRKLSENSSQYSGSLSVCFNLFFISCKCYYFLKLFGLVLISIANLIITIMLSRKYYHFKNM